LGGPKTFKIRRDLGQFENNMIANISETDPDNDKQKTTLSTKMAPAFDAKDLVDFGPLTTKFSCLIRFI